MPWMSPFAAMKSGDAAFCQITSGPYYYYYYYYYYYSPTQNLDPSYSHLYFTKAAAINK